MRTRFAPSPTGFLHVGGLRTALFSWLIAKKTGGTFFLRIEDTDQAREVDGAVANILKALHWAGITPDEGVVLDADGKISEKGDHGPYFQSKRLSLYKEHIDLLLQKGHAYHCFCTSERLDSMRKLQEQRRQAPMYDKTCLQLSSDEVRERLKKGEKYVVRMKVPLSGVVSYEDAIYGKLSFQCSTIDDQVLLKSDGFPTYHLAHVVDDHFMQTDMVIRGEEWLSSLPKHLLLFQYFGWQAPKYAHAPLLLNADRTKLSKRQNSVATEEYITQGYMPEAMINFLALLGWNPGTVQEMFSLQELIDSFSLERVQKAGAVFDTKKLLWIQGQWMRKMEKEVFAQRILPLVIESYPQAKEDVQFLERSSLIQDRITFMKEAPDLLSYFYTEPQPTRELFLNPKQKVTAEILPKILEILLSTLRGIEQASWSLENIRSSLEAILSASGLSRGQMLWPLRAALTGKDFSPGAYEVAETLGREKTLARLEHAKTMIG